MKSFRHERSLHAGHISSGCQRLCQFRVPVQPCPLLLTVMSEADKKALKVKAGVVKRLAKEMAMYEQEVAAEQAKVQRLKDSGADPHDIKYAVSRAWPARVRSAAICCSLA